MAKSHLKSALQSTKTQHKYTQHVVRDPEAALNIVLHYSPHHPKECTRQNPSQTQSTNPRPRNALDKADTPALTHAYPRSSRQSFSQFPRHSRIADWQIISMIRMVVEMSHLVLSNRGFELGWHWPIQVVVLLSLWRNAVELSDICQVVPEDFELDKADFR